MAATVRITLSNCRDDGYTRLNQGLRQHNFSQQQGGGMYFHPSLDPQSAYARATEVAHSIGCSYRVTLHQGAGGLGPHVATMAQRFIGNDIAAIAQQHIGHTEEGNNSGPWVERYQAATPLASDPRTRTGWAWCAAFVSWIYREAGVPLDQGFSLVAELQRWGTDRGFWHRRLAGYQAPVGSIAIFDFDGNDHTGIVITGGQAEDITVEGNTRSETVREGSEAEGDGVFRRTRQHRLITGYVVPNVILPPALPPPLRSPPPAVAPLGRSLNGPQTSSSRISRGGTRG